MHKLKRYGTVRIMLKIRCHKIWKRYYQQFGIQTYCTEYC